MLESKSRTALRIFWILGFGLWLFPPSLASLKAAQACIAGRAYISLDDVARKLHLRYRTQPDGKAASLYNRERSLSFYENRNECILNQYKVSLGSPVLFYKKRLWITKQDFEYTLLAMLAPKHFYPRPKVCHIVLDPGHGGKDQGTQNPLLKLQEKQMTLDVALRLERILKKKGFTVSLTRRSDTFIPLDKRSLKAKDLKADVFISIHFNAVGGNDIKHIKGIETYILPGKNQPSSSRTTLEETDKHSYPGNTHNAWNAFLAYCIHTQLVDNLKSLDRGIKKARFAVLKELPCPGVLVECGFLSNLEEAKHIASKDHREKIALALAEGIVRYKQTLNAL